MIYRIEVSARASADLDSLALWIAKDNRIAAEKLFDRAAALQALARFPRIGSRYYHQRRAKTEIRFAPIPDFAAILAYYEVSDDSETVTIRRFLHGKRNLPGRD